MDSYILKDGLWVPIAWALEDQEARIAKLEKQVCHLEEQGHYLHGVIEMLQVADAGVRLAADQVDNAVEGANVGFYGRPRRVHYD